MTQFLRFTARRTVTGALCAGLSVCGLLGGSAAQAQLLGQASAYNLFTFGNASNSNVEVLGNIAVGGNANFNTYTIASDVSNGSNPAAVIGGDYTNTNGTVNGSILAGGNVVVNDPSITGNLEANGSVTLNSYGSIKGAISYGTTFSNNNSYALGSSVTKGVTTLPVSFGNDQSYLDSVSQALNTLTANSASQSQNGKLILTGTGSQEIFDITAQQLASVTNGISISASSNATVIINVTGGNGVNFAIPNNGMTISGTSSSDVLFNFVDATSISVGPFGASVLAPLATVYGGNGDFHGNLIADSFVGSGLEIHNDDLFNGTVTGLTIGGNQAAVTPEPGVFVSVSSFLAMTSLGLVMGRRKTMRG